MNRDLETAHIDVPNPGFVTSFDQGTANAQLVIGGRYGGPPSLTRIDADSNLVHTVDFRSLYATVLDDWLESDHPSVLDGSFETWICSPDRHGNHRRRALRTAHVDVPDPRPNRYRWSLPTRRRRPVYCAAGESGQRDHR